MPKSYANDILPRLGEIQKWAENGSTDREIFTALDVSSSSFYKWKAEHDEFRLAVESGRKVAINEIENALYKRAVGFKESCQKGMKIRRVKYSNGKKELEADDVKQYTEETYYPPDPASAIFLLKNWARDKKYANDPQLIELRKQAMNLEIDEDDDPHAD